MLSSGFPVCSTLVKDQARISVFTAEVVYHNNIARQVQLLFHGMKVKWTTEQIHFLRELMSPKVCRYTCIAMLSLHKKWRFKRCVPRDVLTIMVKMMRSTRHNTNWCKVSGSLSLKMLGSGSRLLLGGNTWQGYEETAQQVQSGGLLPFKYEQEEEELKLVNDEMEQSDEEHQDGGGDEEVAAREAKKREAVNFDTSLVVYPKRIVNGSLISRGGGTGNLVGWPIDGIPAGLGSVAPQVLKVLPNTDPKLLQHQCNACCLLSVLPGIVHRSPMESLLSTAAACYAAIKDGQPMSTVVIPMEQRYNSWMQSAIRLHQLKAAVLEGVFPFHESVEALTIKRHDMEYKHQLKLGTHLHDQRLDDLYARHAPLEDHIVAWEEHALWYLHLLEHFLWDCLVMPYPMAPPLEAVLTPTDCPSLDACPELAPQLLRDVTVFFGDKRDRAPDHGLADPATLVPLLKAGQEPIYKGWAPRSFLESYRVYLQDEEYTNSK